MAGYLVIAVLLLALGSVAVAILDRWLQGQEQAAYSLRDDRHHGQK